LEIIRENKRTLIMKDIINRLPDSYYNIPYVDISWYQFGEEVNIIPEKFALENKVIPMESYGKVMTVCMAYPTMKILKRIEKVTGKVIKVVRSCEEDIVEMIRIAYRKD
jgi:hypothetical protein